MRVLFDEAGGATAPAPNPLAGGQPAPAPNPAPAPVQFNIPDDFDFRSALPDDLKGSPALAKFQAKGKAGIEVLARSLHSAQQLIGKDLNTLVEIPENITVDQRRALLGRMGLPKDATGYKLEAITEAPAWLSPTDPLAQGLVKKASEFGLFPDQVQGLYKWFADEMIGAAKVQHDKVAADDTAAIEGLRKEWGEAYPAKVKAANFAIEKLGGDELRNAINDAGLGAHPAVVKALAQVGAILGEAVGGGDKGGAGFGNGMTPADAKAKAQGLLNQAMNSKDQFEKRKLNEEAQKLFKYAAGDAVV